MAGDSVKLGESFNAEIKKAGGGPETKPEVKPRHRVIGWGAVVAILASLAYFFMGGGNPPASPVMNEKPGLTESLNHKIGGYLTFKQIRAGQVIGIWGPFHNTIVDEGETALRDCFNANAGTECTDVISTLKFHGLGTSATGIGEADGGCLTELTTQYTGDVRATGTQTTTAANIYSTVATNTIDSGGPVSIQEFCLMNTASGAGIMWTRILTGTITLQTGDGLLTTYSLTIE